MKYIGIAFFLFLLIQIPVFSQERDSAALVRRGDKYLSLLVGYNFWNKHFVELGLAHNQMDIIGPHALGYHYFLSTEIKIDDEWLAGPKVGFWIGNGIGLGLNVICYTDGEDAAWRARPEIGVGLSRFKIVYG